MNELEDAWELALAEAMRRPGARLPDNPVVLTFDDGFCDVFENALPVLQRHQFRAIEFLVADLLGKTSEWQRRDDDSAGPLMDAAQVKEWLATGNEIGSHTLSHPHLTQIPIAQARERSPL